MSDFAFEIAGDASKADRAIDTVLDRLEEIRRKAQQASQANTFDNLARGAERFAQALRNEQAALARTTALHDQLRRQGQPIVQSFAGVAQAIQREREMLESIHGPAQRYAADMQTLNSLLRQGAISEQQFAARAAQVRATIATPQGGPRGVAGLLSGAKGVAAAAGIGVSVREVGQMVDEFQTLQNRLRFLAGGDMQKVNELFGELQGVANRTRGELSSTSEAFVRISLATRQMGLSTSEAMRLTESLNKAIVLSGASSAEAAAGMIQLSQGLASGALRGDELRSVMEQLPAVADVIAKGMGVTRGQLRQLGQDGKITADVIVKAFQQASGDIDRDFGNTAPTLSQQWTVFRNNLTVTIGELDKTLGVSSTLGSVLAGLGEIAKTIIIPFQALGAALDGIGVSGSTAAAVVAGMALGGPLGAVVGLTGGLLAQAGAFDDVGRAASNLIDRYNQWDELVQEAHRDTNGFFGDLNTKAVEALTEFNLRMTLGAAAADSFRKAISGVKEETDAWANATDKGYKGLAGTINNFVGTTSAALAATWDKLTEKQKKTRDETERLRKEYEKLGRALLGGDSEADRALRKAAAERAAFYADIERATQEEIDAEERAAKHAEEARDAKIKAHRDWVESVKKYTDEAAEKRRQFEEDEKRRAEEVSQAWAQGLGSIAADIINMTNEGELSLSRLGTAFAKLAIQIAAMKLGGFGGAFLGAFGSGLALANGGQFMGVPRYDSGGQGMVGGNYGLDNNLFVARVSRDERVTIETPEDQRTGKYFGGRSAPTYNTFMFMDDPSRIVSSLGTRPGEAQLVEFDRRYRRRR